MNNVFQLTRGGETPQIAKLLVKQEQGVEANPENTTPSLHISTTSALQTVDALLFYAGQGFDGGAKARLALKGMQTVIEAR